MATALNPGQHARLLRALDAHRRGALEEAELIYRELLAKVPQCFDALHLLGVVHLQRGELPPAIELLQRATAVDPKQANAAANLAKALLDGGDATGAFAAADRAATLDPGYAEAWYNRALALERLEHREEAVQSYQRALERRPQYPDALGNLGNLWRELRQPAAALECLDAALALEPDSVSGLNSRGLVWLELRRSEAALADFDRALELEPDCAAALNNRGNALLDLRRFAAAAETFARLAILDPNFMYVHGSLLYARRNVCDWRDHEAAVTAVTARVASGARGDFPFSFLCVSGDLQLQLQCARSFTRHEFPLRLASKAAEPAAPGGAAVPAVPGTARIRIAYVSGDFGDHAVSHLLAGIFEAHDRSRFDVFAISWGRRGEGAMRQRLEAAFTRFIDVTDWDDAAVVALMHELQVDIAIDLSGHTRDGRTGVFAQRAAPVQVNFLGLPATMGATYMDYVIADRVLIPDAARAAYTEHVVWLPDVFQPAADPHQVPSFAPRAAFGLPADAVVLCSFNNCAKLNPALFDVWMRLLVATPASVLWLLAANPDAATHLCREAEARGVAAGRLVFADRVDHSAYLSRYAHADLFLDSSPFNAGTTARDALSQGVPLLTVAGASFSGRMSASLLTALGLPELVTHSLSEYEARAGELLREPQRLANLRRRLERLQADGHAVFNPDRYRRHLEAAFIAMAQRSKNGAPPAPLEITPVG